MTVNPRELRLDAPRLEPPEHLPHQLAALARDSAPTPARRRGALLLSATAGAVALCAGGAWATGSVSIPGLPAPGHHAPVEPGPRTPLPPSESPSSPSSTSDSPGPDGSTTGPAGGPTPEADSPSSDQHRPSADDRPGRGRPANPGSSSGNPDPTVPQGKATGQERAEQNRPDKPEREKPTRPAKPEKPVKSKSEKPVKPTAEERRQGPAERPNSGRGNG